MKIIDMHMHCRPSDEAPDSGALLEQMRDAGVWGGAIFSTAPRDPDFASGPDVFARTRDVLSRTEGRRDRLFPFLFINPNEPDALEGARAAVREGIAGFKMICASYRVSDKNSMELLGLIADSGKPVVFHTGILWDGRASSENNRPLNWEAMLEIPRLRFALAHCSWPWTDECVALYGKILNSYVRDPDISCEMFFDLTPGTPEIYRRGLLEKLFLTGYDVPHNIMFGSDCSAPGYNSAWTARWLRVDGKIMDELGVPDKVRQLIYHDNFMRFIGEYPKDFSHISPVPDSLNQWSLEREREYRA